MELLNVDISLLSYKDIKSEIDKIEINEEINNENFIKLVNLLKKDSRKNIITLALKLERQKEKLLNEIERVRKMYEFDRSFGDYKYVAGVDEVGRGPLAGPIVACAIIFDSSTLEDDFILGLNDSKKLSEKKREELAVIIKEKALDYHIALCSNDEIDTKGISYCNNNIFQTACTSMKLVPDLILSDGYLIRNIDIENKSVIKGDTKSAAIAAASILAKVYRDNLMKDYSKEYPYFSFDENAGYGTSKHIEALKKYGPCKIHRKSFLTRLI